MKKQFRYLFALAIFLPLTASAHPGRTDASGCHTCRTNCAKWGLSTGEYHCHQSKGVEQPVAPIHSVRATETTPAYTVPAPEYTIPKAKPAAAKPKALPVAVKINQPKVLVSTSSTSTLKVDESKVVPRRAVAVPSPVVVQKSPWYFRMFGF